MPAAKKAPTKEQLVQLLKLMSQRQIAKQFGVCEKTIRKWKVKHGIANQKSAYFRRPARAVLIKLLGKMNQKQIAEKFGVCEHQVLAWKRHHNIEHVPSIHMIPAEERGDNPIVECQCGCGETFPKWKFGRRPGDGKLWRYERRFVNGHASTWHAEQRRVQLAEHWANDIGNYAEKMGADYDANKGGLDASDEYLGEAWLALAEGDCPQERVKQQRKHDNELKNKTCNIETVLRHPDIVETVCSCDPEPED